VQPNANVPTLLGFAGELRDPSGLIYLRARWYDVGTGRFMSRDALLGSLLRPVTLNAYGYAAGRPNSLVDPLGLDPQQANLAYWMADLLEQLDDPNPWIAATAWVETVAVGEAAFWLTVAGGAAAYRVVRFVPRAIEYISYSLGPAGPVFAPHRTTEPQSDRASRLGVEPSG